jgi:hypothetical protein
MGSVEGEGRREKGRWFVNVKLMSRGLGLELKGVE